MRLAEPVRRLEFAAATDHAGGVFGTSHSACALGSFDVAATLGDEGVPLGRVLSSGGQFFYDPFVVYSKRSRYNVTNPNMAVLAELGAGKSTAVQVYLRREWCLGRYIRVIDPSRIAEYTPLARDLGGEIIRLHRDGGVVLNPLESPETRHGLLKSMASAAMRRDLGEREPALLNAALDAAGKNPVLPAVLDRLFKPTDEMGQAVGTTARRFAAEARDAAMALQPLCYGDLAGLFDGPTTADVDFNNQFILLDLSTIEREETLGILMACAISFLQAQIDRHYRQGELVGRLPKSILVIDEGWRILALPGVAAWLQERFKVSRKEAQQNIAIFHGFRDLDTAGDEGKRLTKLAQGLVRDCDTFLLGKMGKDDAEEARRLLGLSQVECDLIKEGLEVGDFLARIGSHRFVIEIEATPDDLAVTSPDKAMTG